MSVELTDAETAVLIDSLVFTRDHIRDLQGEPVNIESALDKIKSLMTPATFGLRIEGIQA